MGDHDNNNTFSNPKASILLFGICSAALVVSVYHCIVAGWCRSRPGALQNANRTPLPRTLVDDTLVEPSIEENSIAYLITAHKYQKGDSLVGESTCSICLCEFEEGEELRTLPECAHPFHAPCIDMWLYSHTSCPMCRAQATPSPRITFPSSSPGSNQHDQLTLERVIVHTSLL